MSSHRSLPPVLILAAGASRRTGPMPKSLWPVEGQPWILWQLKSLQRMGIAEVILVVGHHAESISRVVTEFQKSLPEGALTIRLVLNANPERGVFSSLQTGLREIFASHGFSGGTFVLPIDVPVGGPEVWNELKLAEAKGFLAAKPVLQGGGGHPVWLSSVLMERLIQRDPLAPESRLDRVLRSLSKYELSEVEVKDQRVTMNLNTPEDFAKLPHVAVRLEFSP